MLWNVGDVLRAVANLSVIVQEFISATTLWRETDGLEHILSWWVWTLIVCGIQDFCYFFGLVFRLLFLLLTLPLLLNSGSMDKIGGNKDICHIRVSQFPRGFA